MGSSTNPMLKCKSKVFDSSLSKIYPKITIIFLINEHMEFNCLITHTHNATIREICEAFVGYTSTLCLGLVIMLNGFVDPTFQQIGKIRNTHKLYIYI
jgi:hypothetical protein